MSMLPSYKNHLHSFVWRCYAEPYAEDKRSDPYTIPQHAVAWFLVVKYHSKKQDSGQAIGKWIANCRRRNGKPPR